MSTATTSTTCAGDTDARLDIKIILLFDVNPLRARPDRSEIYVDVKSREELRHFSGLSPLSPLARRQTLGSSCKLRAVSSVTYAVCIRTYGSIYDDRILYYAEFVITVHCTVWLSQLLPVEVCSCDNHTVRDYIVRCRTVRELDIAYLTGTTRVRA